MKRRNFIKSLCATSALVATISPSMLMAKDEKPKGGNPLSYAAAIEAITGGKAVADSDKVKLTVPEIAENGAVVPVKVEVDNPMEADNYVKAIHVLSTKNANARCADVMLTPLNGQGYFATRVKLGGTQDVVALVELSNGTFMRSAKSVKVTIGGCG
ncbi:MAG TPA: thiosulfate oxidation carrier protein SoxY [Sulfurovum sp.]|nr:MAG: thiosulfate oxidation carrier protein SoxY [Sulfurovum sp. 35-42-20]OYY54741.1 MAG: thiosulfate oxidation carrier protein SoxY [Sulfurovum sp. 28-43-6]OYZ47487.1 MAG: thiosulfate oxidation carrier protein SoxY [Sulfurovum sp. 24-42-9]OZA42740.1 MAG: thiosulfate oxidation carrier protein SoxY [Sulfurovum sp. 17-42-90]OZA60993.1 MAG: thiosulfate oxidation carrier protein SoxY [Sulfurovum sp. 39-42-12]HQR73039.1 thiosulfate oxidation carrier protein SoxY [Sulfurovum sp.]